jgi:hypothetical protein
MRTRLCSVAASMLLMMSLQGCFPVVAAGVGKLFEYLN